MLSAEVDLNGMRLQALPPAGFSPAFSQIQIHDYDLEPVEDELYRAGLENVPNSDLSIFVVLLEEPGPSTGIMGTELPLLPPDPAAFSTATLNITTSMGSTVVAELQTLTLPEPREAASLLACLACGWAFGGVKRRRAGARVGL